MDKLSKPDIGRLVLYALPFALLAVGMVYLYGAYGLEWDFAAHYLNAEALLGPGFLQTLSQYGHAVPVTDSIIMSGNVYFETYRAPLSYALLAVALLVSGHYAIPIFMLTVVAALAVAAYAVSRAFGINPLLVASLLVSPYLILFQSLFDSEALLSLAMLVGAIALLKKDRWEAGLLMAAAGLSKYTALIFLPLLLLAGSRKKVAYACAAFAIATLPWLLFNYFAVGNPLYSYIASIKVSGESTVASGVSVAALAALLTYFIPAAIALLCILFLERNRLNFMKGRGLASEKRGVIMLAAAILLSLVEFTILGLHNDAFDQARYSYVLYASAALILGYAISSIGRRAVRIGRWKMKSAEVAAAVLLAFSLIAVSSTLLSTTYLNGYFGSASGSTLYGNAIASLAELNLSNCIVVSNAWIYLRYHGINAYSPFAYNETPGTYPSVVFSGVGVNWSDAGLPDIAESYNYNGYSIYLPKGRLCA